MAIVYDFDLTLTSVHTNGIPLINIDYFGDRLPKIRTLFQNQQGKHPIYINTRGLRDKVSAYLQSRGLLQYVAGVYGADTLSELFKDNWPLRKVRVLDHIRKKHGLPKDQVYFYDDTPENISMARAHGYVNSMLIQLAGVEGRQ